MLTWFASYRLNIFGFPGAPAAFKNAGMLDVRMVYAILRDL